MAKSSRRKKQQLAKSARKREQQTNPGGNSAYARKRRGLYPPNSMYNRVCPVCGVLDCAVCGALSDSHPGS